MLSAAHAQSAFYPLLVGLVIPFLTVLFIPPLVGLPHLFRTIRTARTSSHRIGVLFATLDAQSLFLSYLTDLFVIVAYLSTVLPLCFCSLCVTFGTIDQPRESTAVLFSAGDTAMFRFSLFVPLLIYHGNHHPCSSATSRCHSGVSNLP